MRALRSSLRKQLETSVLAARRTAEAASRAAIESLGVFADRRPEHLDAAQAALRNGLRAKWRQLGNDRDSLVAECAYEQWHRLLFARFLAENGLLLHPQFRAPVTLDECEELAEDLGEPDAWSVAARFAAEILPGIFRLDNPCVRLRLAPEGRYALEQTLEAIPAETFVADDALGWVYQFWQKDKKDEINASERKVGGADLGPVTQLFTENYMVRFLLENSLGAWWAARHPDSRLLKGFEYLRFDDGGNLAAGAFEDWPDRVAEVTVMDPCCGSGHFLVEAFSMLWQMRAEEEGLAPIEAQDAVLRDNLFGLELDPRCVQITMFNVALHAWKVGGGWRQLLVPNIACSGIPVKAPAEEWKALAAGDQRLEKALLRLHILFRDADTLGSLIDPKRLAEISDPSRKQMSFEDVAWSELVPLLERALLKEPEDQATSVIGFGAVALSRAADLLSRSYTLVVTNVPYLGRGRQTRALRDYTDRFLREGAPDLAGACALRLREFAAPCGTIALVLPETMFFLKSFEAFRELALTTMSWYSYAALGPGAFEAISGEVVQPVLWTASVGQQGGAFVAMDCRSTKHADEKALMLASGSLLVEQQNVLRRRPGMKVALGLLETFDQLSRYAKSVEGLSTGDSARYRQFFWEVAELGDTWERFQMAPSAPGALDGLSTVIRWEGGSGPLAKDPGARIQGLNCWRRRGVLVGRMGAVVATGYLGYAYDKSCVVLLPYSHDNLEAITAFALDPSYERAIRSFDKKIGVATASMVEVPVDIDHWREVAEQAGTLPESWSDDPTQWLFKGRPEVSTTSLQVAVARLVGYRWPEQAKSDELDAFADADGILCLPAVAGEPPAVDRVQQLLAAAFSESWTPAKVKELLEQTGSKKNLAAWLRDEFFKQHCTLFGNRPFIWHIWDGQRDGFSALVNYHRLERKTLEKLTYTYLGQDWVERQRAGVRDGVAGAEARLAAALGLQSSLEAILEGEAPLDIYIRWKEIHEQPIGWEPDLNDGVRINIRPFIETGVLRSPVNIHWRKDRGRNPDGTERLNDVHLTLAEKIEARKRVGRV
jgi:MmeI, DNA-methyltransferase domain